MSPRLEIDRDERDDARDEPRRRGQGVRIALLALAVTGLVGGSWWVGHRSAPATQDASAVPEIHPDTAPVKEPPKDPGGLIVPDQDSVLLNRDAKSKPEELLPPAEAVKPRPAPPPQAATASPPPPPAPLAPAASAPPQTASPAPPVPPPAAAPQVAVTPPAPVVAPAPAAPKATPPATGSYRLQLGALKTEEAAKTEWQKLQRQNSDVLGKLSLAISRVDLGGGKGIYYRIQAGPIADEAKAARDCAALKSRKIGCILVKP